MAIRLCRARVSASTRRLACRRAPSAFAPAPRRATERTHKSGEALPSLPACRATRDRDLGRQVGGAAPARRPQRPGARLPRRQGRARQPGDDAGGAVAALNPRVSHRRATRAVERALAPEWVDNVDLRASDRGLDGERFLGRPGARDARSRNRRPAVRHPAWTRKPASGRAAAGGARSRRAPPARLDWSRPCSRAWPRGHSRVSAKRPAANPRLALSAFGLSDSNANCVRRSRTSESARRAGQTHAGAKSPRAAGFSTLVIQIDSTIGETDYAMSQLALLAKLPADDPTKREFTRTVVDCIGSHLSTRRPSSTRT